MHVLAPCEHVRLHGRGGFHSPSAEFEVQIILCYLDGLGEIQKSFQVEEGDGGKKQREGHARRTWPGAGSEDRGRATSQRTSVSGSAKREEVVLEPPRACSLKLCFLYSFYSLFCEEI